MIRPLNSDDISSLQSIDQSAHGEHWPARVFLDQIDKSDRVHLVAHEADGIVGHAAALIDGPSCRISNVAVHRDHAGEGHGSALLLAVLQAALSQHRIANMQLEVRPANRRAQRMYSRFGFVPVGIERDFYDRRDESGSSDAVVMMVADVHAASFRDRLDEIAAQQQPTIENQPAGKGAAA